MSKVHKIFILKLIWILTGPIIVACQWNTEKEQQKINMQQYPYYAYTIGAYHSPSNPSSFLSTTTMSMGKMKKPNLWV
jgi:hypothetical protein